VNEIVQGSPEWIAIRLGRVTASRVADVVARTKSGWGASRANYMAELIAERLTGVAAEAYVNGTMQWGIAQEADARAAYEWLKQTPVQEVGFVPHPTIAMSGASPDGLIADGLLGDQGLVELKCPQTATHIETLLGQKVPEKYITQMQWQMACCERAFCDYVSYDPRLPEPMRLFVRRIPRDNARIAELEKDVVAFLQELDDKLGALNQLRALA
jgi:putative phage-type endonuclease